ncbi:MAG: peptidase [Armatimonadetes bacterium]|nr:peptidase [Armatimonadota bacterium]
MPRRRAKQGRAEDKAAANFARACEALRRHPMFSPLYAHAHVFRWDEGIRPPDGWAVVSSAGQVHAHPTRRCEPEVWVYILAHSLLHLGFGHFQTRERPREWNAACDVFVTRFLAALRLGQPPPEMPSLPEIPARSEDALYEHFCERGIPPELRGFGTAGPGERDMLFVPEREMRWRQNIDWQACFGTGLAAAVASAVNVAGGYEPSLGADKRPLSPARRARDWFISSYPLLGALAATFDIIEDPALCGRMGISVAAVDSEAREVYLNPAAGLDERECRFVMAHELLHVGLRHELRRRGRDPFLWNVACDYVINGWLVEMGVGELPQVCGLYDPALKGESAEAIYDRIVLDLRRYRKLATLRGIGECDMLGRHAADWWKLGPGLELDEFYRRCLGQGLAYHEDGGRGFLPAGLVEEIRALSQPPIPWDVELAQWFDDHFSPLEKVRSYARPSRRQSATPDIPRPRWVPALGAEDGRTFGVVLDTSGSMDRSLLAKALGAIAGYSTARDVPAVRVVFCDALAYDQGYLPPEAIAGRVRVRGRGGTVLQPGVDLLERAEDFPKDGPLLLITDGYCDRLRVRREHAFLIPEGHHLPFVPRGKVFRLR